MKLNIGEKIALLRKKKGITQTELAEYLYLAPQTVSRWEVGCGAPEITLLPKIAAFFDVTIDDLFGLTSLERTEDLVCKYSVLRDDNSFKEAMSYIDSQLQTIDALLQADSGDPAELQRDKDQLEAEKMHMWIQQGREAFQRAFTIADRFVQKTKGAPKHPWYLRMRLQRDQLCSSIGTGREALTERREDFAEHPGYISLLRYLCLLDDRQEYEDIISIAKADGPATDIIFPPTEENLSAWWPIIRAAAKLGDTGFIEQYLPPVLDVCGKEDKLDFLTCLLDVYAGEKLAEVKRQVRALLPEVSINKYFEEKIKEKIEG